MRDEEDIGANGANGVCDFTEDKVDALVKLEELTRMVADLSAFTKSNDGGYAEYDVGGGVGIGRGLLKKPCVAVQDLVFSAGSSFPEHVHNEIEVLTFYEGKTQAVVNGDEFEIGPRETLILNPGDAHSFKFVTKVRILAVTMPASKDYPDAGCEE